MWLGKRYNTLGTGWSCRSSTSFERVAAGVAHFDALGVAAVEAHARELTAYLHDGLRRVPGARVHSPCDPAQATGIATVSLGNVDGVTLSAALRERWRIITRPALYGTTVRISLAAFVKRRDVDLLLEALTTLANA